MKTQLIAAAALILALFGLQATPAGAAWSNDPDENNPICVATGMQASPQAVSDGAGGTIFAWEDSRSGIPVIYAQRIDASGVTLWGSGGVPVCTATGSQIGVQLVADGAGGVILAWDDYRGGWTGIFAQRVAHDGTLLWAADGVPIAQEDVLQMDVRMISDGAGGAIICWEEHRSGEFDIAAQRVNSNGARQWTSGGVTICDASWDQQDPRLVGDGAGGAIICWYDNRMGGSAPNIYAQRVDDGGTAQWAANGTSVCSTAEDQRYPEIAADGTGGAFIVWMDSRSGTSDDLYLQRMLSDGSQALAIDGVAVCTAVGGQMNHVVQSDGDEGVIIVWSDQRVGVSENDVYAQRIRYDGTPLWAADGVAVCAAANYQGWACLIVDDAGEAVIAWKDRRRGVTDDIYAQRLDPDGAPMWAVDGIAVSTAWGNQYGATLAGHDDGRAVLAWRDFRNGDQGDIYAQQIERHGHLGDPGPVVTEVVDNPDDQGGLVVLSWAPSYLDAYPQQLVTHYSVWRRVPPARSGETDPDRSGWVHVEDVSASYWDEYGSVAPTFGIHSGTGHPEMTDYKVVAQTADQWVYWESAVASGYSTDELAPGAPLDLTGTPSGPDVELAWNASGSHDEDLAHYNVYRGDTPGFTPDGSTLVGSADDTAFIDPAPGAGTWHYLVTGEDVHGNEGLASNETSAATAPSATLAVALDCQPSTGVVPFVTQMTVSMGNLYTEQVRRFAARVNVQLAGGASYPNWRAGFTNVAAGDTFTMSWNQNIPALGTLIGNNVFSLLAQDVTPAPYNQPPYPPSGDTAADSCTITAMLP